MIQNETLSISQPDYRDLPLSALQESPFNPRQRYPEASLRELAHSIQAQGVLAPLLVRPLEDSRYEIIAGSRRFRAARLAGLETVPVRLVDLSDAEAQIAATIENLQREDIHPLEEARAFVNLADQHMDAPTIAAKVGKSPAFVAQRMRLTALIPQIAEAFLEGKITVGHALLIAKLPPAEQPEAFTAAFRSVHLMGGQTSVLVPVRELAAWIESNLLLDLDRAPFNPSDAMLVPEAGSCLECPKQTGFNSLLFPDSQVSRCTDRDCWAEKVNRHVARALEQNPKLIQISTGRQTRDGGPLGADRYTEIKLPKNARKSERNLNPAQKKCPHMARAISVDGATRGQVVTICAEPTCTIHHAASRQAREAWEKARAEQRQQAEKRKEEIVARERILAAILAKVPAPLAKADLELVAAAFLRHSPPESTEKLLQRHKPTNGKPGAAKDKAASAAALLKTADERTLCALLIEMCLLDSVYSVYSADGSRRLEAVAKRYRVASDKIRQAVTAEFAARRKKQEARAKAAVSGKAEKKKHAPNKP